MEVESKTNRNVSRTVNKRQKQNWIFSFSPTPNYVMNFYEEIIVKDAPIRIQNETNKYNETGKTTIT